MSTKLARRNIGFHGDRCSIKQWQLVALSFRIHYLYVKEEFSGDALGKSMLGCKVEKVGFGVFGFGFGRGCRCGSGGGCRFNCERGRGSRFGFGRGKGKGAFALGATPFERFGCNDLVCIQNRSRFIGALSLRIVS
jgi:hypothetical protein